MQWSVFAAMDTKGMFDEEQWGEVRQFAEAWLKFKRPARMLQIAEKNNELWQLSFEDLGDYGYHSKCRTSFTNKSKLKSSKQSHQEQGISEPGSSVELQIAPTSILILSPKVTRSRVSTLSQPGNAILQAKCIICQKSTPLTYKVKGTMFNEKLMKCETISGGEYHFFS